MLVAALDLGTNTFLCLIAEVADGQIKKIIDDQVQVVRLGQGVSKSKRFHPEALERARKCLTDFSKLIQKHKPQKILAMATSAARDVENAQELFAIGKDLGIPIEVIPGDKEAQITYQGAISGQKNQQQTFAVVDVGGGSTELIFGHGQKVVLSKSMDIGCVRLTEEFLPKQPATTEQIKSLREKIKREIAAVTQKILAAGSIDCLLAVAGTPTELAKVEIGKFDCEKIEGFSLTLEKLQGWQEKFSQHTPAEITQKFSVDPGRADVILVGVLILQEICRALQKDKMTVSTRGVRFGVALEIDRRQKA